LSIITFNYDRSLENYLFTALKNKYPDKTDDEYAKKVQSIPVIHVHGKLGIFPWEAPKLDLKNVVPYDSMSFASCHGLSDNNGKIYRPIWFNNAKNSIKVMHEGTDKSEEFEQAHEKISKAQQLYFLGFGYHPTNLRRLNPDVLKKPNTIKGTIYGLSHSRILNIERQGISVFNRKNNNLFNDKIYDFLHDHICF